MSVVSINNPPRWVISPFSQLEDLVDMMAIVVFGYPLKAGQLLKTEGYE